MRVMLTAHMPHETFNAAVRKGTVEGTLKRILEESKPEAAYFTELDGRRCGILFLYLPDASHIPRMAEPWFLAFNADVTFRICMTPADLAKADLGSIAKKWI